MLTLNNENDSYKIKVKSLQEQKLELIEILNSKNIKIEKLLNDYISLKDDFELKIQKLDPSTCSSGSYGMSQSNSIGALFKLIGIKVSNSRYNEDNLKTLLKKFEQTIASKKTAETDNRFLRDKLDEVMITTILYLTLLL